MSNLLDHGTLYAGIGQRIRDLRVERGLTQTRLAELLSLSRTSVTNIENGRQKLLVHTMVEIATILEVDASALLPEVKAVEKRSVEAAMPEELDETDRQFLRKIVYQPRGE
jgi:transcriptional regulator with XRE-family HTH domain